MSKQRELIEQRLKVVAQSREILDKAEAEDNRDLTQEEEARFVEANAEIDSLKDRIERYARQEALEAEEIEVAEKRIAEIQTDATVDEVREGIKVAGAEKREAMNQWCRAGYNEVAEDKRHLLNVKRVEGGVGPTFSLSATPPVKRYLGDGKWATDMKETRAAQTVTTTGGGDVIQDEAMLTIDAALLDFGGMRQAGSRVIRTSTGADLPLPTIDDTSNKGRLLAINTGSTNTALTYGQVVLGSYKFSSDHLLVPVELMQDSSFDYQTHVAAALGERLGRIQNQYFTVGDGSGEPDGVKNIAESAVTTVASATAIAADELIDLQGQLDSAYEDNAVWMWKKSTQTAVRKLKDSNNNYLWSGGEKVGGFSSLQDSFLGQPVVVNQDLRAIGADKRSVLYGNFGRGYIIRDVMDVTFIRLDERFMDSLQVGFLAITRNDGAVIQNGTPIVGIRHPAS